MKKTDLNNMNAAALAYMGDAVYEQAVRRRILEQGIRRVDRLQKTAAGNYVNAGVQAEVIRLIFDDLKEEEQIKVRRWRNYKPHSKPKNAEMGTYQWATAFEALIGYLYLSGDEERLEWLLDKVFETIEGSE